MGRLFAPSATGFRLTLTQSFTIADESTRPRPAVLRLQGYVLGPLRSPCKGLGRDPAGLGVRDLRGGEWDMDLR